MHQLRWRKAIIISIVVQILFLGGVGWMAAKFFVPQEAEQYLEIELTTQVEEDEKAKIVAPKQPNVTTSVSTASNRKTQPAAKVGISAESMFIADGEVVTNGTESMVNGGTSGGTIGGAKGDTGSGNTPLKQGGGITKPRVTQKVEPIYPLSAQEVGSKGEVVVKMKILKNGHAGKIVVIRSSGNEELDNAVIVAVQQYRFEPAREQDSGNPVEYDNVKLSVKFNLNVVRQ